MSVIRNQSSPLRVHPQPTLTITKSERTRSAIMNAALDFIWSRPFRDMTVNSLMAPTGVGRSAFYQYFKDLHEVMETLLNILQKEIYDAAEPWVAGVGDPVALLRESITGLVDLLYQRGPLVRAVSDAAPSDKRLEKAWVQFLGEFDNATCTRIEADQKQDLIPNFDTCLVAIALTRLNAFTLIEAFGQHPRTEPEPVREALVRIWVSTLYGAEWLEKKSSDLVRT
jgi:TetR/AcrR family transcriptional regulator, ethionamide resistance regulator